MCHSIHVGTRGHTTQKSSPRKPSTARTSFWVLATSDTHRDANIPSNYIISDSFAAPLPHLTLTVVPRKGSCLEFVYWYSNWLYTLAKVLYLAHLKRAVVRRKPTPHSRQGQTTQKSEKWLCRMLREGAEDVGASRPSSGTSSGNATCDASSACSRCPSKFVSRCGGHIQWECLRCLHHQ